MTIPRIQANGLSFAYLSWGPADGPLALLLHGFPDSAHTWRHLAPELAADGWRVVAPWLRGYAPTEVPPGRIWHLPELAADVNALHEALAGGEDAVLVGHDWGAILGYRALAAEPARWRRMVGLAVPPEPVAIFLAATGYVRRSRYILSMQLPGASRLFTRRGGRFVRRLWRDWSPGYEATNEDLDPVLAATSTEDGARAMLAYYRGLFRAIVLGTAYRPRAPMPTHPILYLHGAEDGCVGPMDRDRLVRRLPEGSEAEQLAGVGHFLHLEDPTAVNGRIRAFVAS
ncbi:MAG: alpha/beta hydrolase [Nitriliruptorales bacterium]|nr:alpha/beta hydrolase [Nitriliruptorales bacterium]